jgi:hypothetical protein
VLIALIRVGINAKKKLMKLMKDMMRIRNAITIKVRVVERLPLKPDELISSAK